MIDQEFVKYVISALVNKPEAVEVERTVDERGVLLTLKVDPEDLGRVIGRKGSTAQSLRTLLRALGSKNEAHYNLRIVDDDAGGGYSRPSRNKAEPEADFVSSSDDQAPEEAEEQAPTEDAPEEASDDSLDKTKKELDDLSDDLL